MAHYIDADLLLKEIDRRYEENRERARYDDYHRGMNDGLDHLETFLDSLQQEQPEVDLEKEINKWVVEDCGPSDFNPYADHWCADDIIATARHFAEWGARHSINWGDVQLLDTFILELSREEKDGTDWGDSEKFYTEVLRRFHEFNDKKISEIVAEWGAEHARKEDK